jgi:hypothetical protein
MVLYQTPARRDEALEMLDRASKLDPLEADYDVFKAVFLFYRACRLEACERPAGRGPPRASAGRAGAHPAL